MNLPTADARFINWFGFLRFLWPSTEIIAAKTISENKENTLYKCIQYRICCIYEELYGTLRLCLVNRKILTS